MQQLVISGVLVVSNVMNLWGLIELVSLVRYISVSLTQQRLCVFNRCVLAWPHSAVTLVLLAAAREEC